ncbi:MAG: transposase [Clostridia bacterium]|nr:transposase [Clostridia bacterium]
MSRIPRNSLDSTFFHVIVQGINKEKIFYKDLYKETYLKKLLDKQEEYKINIIAYCVMDNHTHTVIYTENISNLSNYMKSINISYSRFYNKLETRVGYVFRNRFLSEPILNQKYLINCLKYVHCNPIKANLVTYEGDYKYSSYNDYLNFTGIVNNSTLDLINLDKKDYKSILLENNNNSQNLDENFKSFHNLSLNKKNQELLNFLINELNIDCSVPDFSVPESSDFG